MRSVADILYHFVANESQDFGLSYVAVLPEAPDETVGFFDTAGRFDGRIMRTGERIEHPGVQIQVRGKNYLETYQRAKDLSLLLDGVIRQTVYIQSDEVYTLHNVSRSGAIIPVGIEIAGSRRRHLFTINMTVTVTEDEVDADPGPAMLTGLGSYWELHDTLWLDSHGTQHLTLVGSVPIFDGKIVNSAGFDGNSANRLQRQPITDNFTFTDMVNGFSYQAWVRLKTLAVDQSIIGNYRVGDTLGWKLMYITTENGFAGVIGDGNFNEERNISDVECVLGQWHHVVFVAEVGGGICAIYVDNVKRTDSNIFPDGDNGCFFRIGGDGGDGIDPNSIIDPANADICEVAIWPARSLIDSEVDWLWNSGNGRSFQQWI